jgi:cell shape-determining protein MreD
MAAHRDRDERSPAGWTAGVLFDALVPLVIGLAILAFAILAFVESSSNHPSL